MAAAFPSASLPPSSVDETAELQHQVSSCSSTSSAVRSLSSRSTTTNGDTNNDDGWNANNRRGGDYSSSRSCADPPLILTDDVANMVASNSYFSSMSSSSNNMACDHCRETPDSLISDVLTLPCLHTLCRKCLQPQGNSNLLTSPRFNCPICDTTIGGGGSGNREETAAAAKLAMMTPPPTSKSLFNNTSFSAPFSLYSSLLGGGSSTITSRGDDPSIAARVLSPPYSNTTAAGNASSSAATPSPFMFNEQLNVDTSLFIGNWLDSVSINDDTQLKGFHGAGQRYPPPLSSTTSSKPLSTIPNALMSGGAQFHPPSATMPAAASSSFRQQSPRILTPHQQQQQAFSLAVGSQRTGALATPPPFGQQQGFTAIQQHQPAKIGAAAAAVPAGLPPVCSICLDVTEATCRCDDCVEYLCAKCVQAHLRVRLTKDHRIVFLHPHHLLPQQQQQRQASYPYSLNPPGPSSAAFPVRAAAIRPIGPNDRSTVPSQQNIRQHVDASSSQQQQQQQQYPAASGFCLVHHFEPFVFFCETCAEPLCKFCTADPSAHPISTHRISPIRPLTGQAIGAGGSSGDMMTHQPAADAVPLTQLFTDANQSVRMLDEAVRGVDHMIERVETRMHSVANEIRAVIHHHIGALEERKRELLERVDSVRTAKLNALNSQKEQLRKHMTSSKSALEQAENVLKSSQHVEGDAAIRVRSVLQDKLRTLTSSRPCLQPQEDDQLSFSSPDVAILKTVRLLGNIVTGAYALNCTLLGDTLRRAVKDKPIYYTVQARDHVGEPLTCGGDQINGFVVATSASAADPSSGVPAPPGTIPVDVFDKRNGTYICRYEPRREGEYQVHIFVRGCPIRGSPFKLIVSRGRDYSSIGATPLLSFGGEGSGDGQLCRPWGICCDKQGRIIVADRSNSRIQIFDQEGKFLHKFGSPGSRNGQFDRPAGVSVNSRNQIIIVDKDNHRVQVFTSECQFLFKFGEKGRGNGQFNYPWDVAVSSNDDSIAISDTRNHRVQLFDARGNFLNKFGFESSFFYKQFDSPRGLVFAPDGRLFCTDFNNHRLAVIDVVHSQMEFFGREGEYDGAFKRPQGLDMDLEGHLIIADSRNNRVQVFTPQLTFLCSFGIEGYPPKGRSLIDRPCDVCVCEGKIYVVDFGNNKIHVY